MQNHVIYVLLVCNFFAHNLDLFFIDVNDRNDNKRT